MLCKARFLFVLLCFAFRVRTKSWILEKVWKFANYFSRPGRSMEIKGKVLKNGIKSGIFLKVQQVFKASWNLCNVADFTWINLANGKTLHNRRWYGRRVRLFQVREPSLQCPALHYSSLCLQCIMVYLFPALVERSKQCLFAFMH